MLFIGRFLVVYNHLEIRIVLCFIYRHHFNHPVTTEAQNRQTGHLKKEAEVSGIQLVANATSLRDATKSHSLDL